MGLWLGALVAQSESPLDGRRIWLSILRTLLVVQCSVAALPLDRKKCAANSLARELGYGGERRPLKRDDLQIAEKRRARSEDRAEIDTRRRETKTIF